MSIARICSAPFSIADFIVNTQCYYEPIMSHWTSFTQDFLNLLQLYIHFNLFVLSKIWFPCLFLIIVVGTFFFILSLFPDEEEQLTPLEQEVMRAVYRNASTGCTARMIHCHMENAPSMDKINHALDRLKSRGVILPVKTTLWIISGY